ncbi:hypothetical protein D918_02530 [Trichuris suis]|nr:hypothetical protein D918_02530 [Trichuris suis]
MCKLEYEFRNPGESLAMTEVYRHVRRFYEKLSEEEKEPLRIMEEWDQKRISKIKEELQLHQKLALKRKADDSYLKRPWLRFHKLPNFFNFF